MSGPGADGTAYAKRVSVPNFLGRANIKMDLNCYIETCWKISPYTKEAFLQLYDL